MKKSRFLWILVLLFGFAFFWAGNNKAIPGKPVQYHDLTPANIKEHIAEAAGLWDRLYRFVALKSAVEKKLYRRHYVQLRNIPLTMQQAVIAVEDNRFYRHYGFDLEGILRASLVNLQAGEVVEGGSTITQQLVKNLFLTQEQTWGRKAEEFLLALNMELQYSKEEILEFYLNTIYYGADAYGIGPAASVYFDKTPSELTLAESALLAGLPNAPSSFSPYQDRAAAKNRQGIVLQAMVKHGYIGPAAAQDAKVTSLHYVK